MRDHVTLRLAVMAGSFALVTPAPGVASLVPLEQQRSVHAFIIVPPCQTKSFQDDAAAGFGPFAGQVELSSICDLAEGAASARQLSTLEASVFEATGLASSHAAAAPSVIHAIADSVFDVTFELTEAAAVSITGTISSGAGDAEAPAVAGSLVTLFDAAGVTIFEASVQPGPNGRTESLEIQTQLDLEAGAYRIRASASSIIDHEMPPARSGESAFDLRLGVGGCVEDLDGDGVVDVEDLVAVIVAWGTDDPAADVDGSGLVDVADLVQVVLAWGDCP